MKLIDLSGTSIATQLQIEEALLRASSEEWCLTNMGTSPAIIMGISGSPETLIHLDLAKKASLPIYKRYSGGGTVVVDADTIFVTFICNSSCRNILPFPKEIMKWSQEVYQPFFQKVPFSLKENDYVIEGKKCGGNAQYLQKERFVHHTSFLWDYRKSFMDCLKLPPKRPEYRQDRPHESFLCPLKNHYPDKDELYNELKMHLKMHFETLNASLGDILFTLDLPHRKSTCQIEF